MTSEPKTSTELRSSSILAWSGISHVVKTKQGEKALVQGVSGDLTSGQMLAIMGPSGAGKSTFLDVLAGRKAASAGSIQLDGNTNFDMRSVSAYVEQEDALLGVLTCRETLSFAARLSAGKIAESPSMKEDIDDMLQELGLRQVAGNKIGTPIQRGISGGQKRRVSLGCAAITDPQILFLDEVTSGLDSTAALHVTQSVKALAKTHNMIVLASIHQPNFEVLSLFDKVLVLANGSAVFSGPPSNIAPFCRDIGHPIATYSNPADHIINLINADFDLENQTILARIDAMRQLNEKQSSSPTLPVNTVPRAKTESSAPSRTSAHFVVLCERALLNYSRNLLAYGIRGAMYVGMAVMMALIWIKIGTDQDRVQDRLSVQFYAVAFLSFMSVAGVPSFLEDRSVFKREHANGLYGPGIFSIVQALVCIPFLVVCVVLFSVIAYWSMGLHPGASHFFKYMPYTFLAIYTAEAQTALIAALLPIFVAALAVTAFANGFWMSVGGYFNMHLAAFWRKSFHYMDYQAYSFQLLVRNDLLGLIFQCDRSGGQCRCIYPSSLPSSQCAFTGSDVIEGLGYTNVTTANWIGILISIAVIYRLALYLVVKYR